MTMSPALDSGAVVAARFVVDRVAGEGAMGRVYRARDRERNDVAVALKVFHTRGATKASEREARTLLDIVHPSIVRCIAFGATDNGQDFIATEWLDGETLRAVLSRGALSVDRTVHVTRRVAEGLAVAHAWGIVHRDVTPANVMLDGDDVKLLDFGIAVHAGAGGAAGTVGYAAPEQARGDAAVPASDVFSLGCVACECLLGEKPFTGDSDVAIMADMLEGGTARVTAKLRNVPDDLVKLLSRMLAADPDERPRDGAAVAAELASFATAPDPMPSARSVSGREARACQVLVAEMDAAPTEHLVAELAELGARLLERSDARVVCAWSKEASAVERAVRGARAALAVRRADARARVSLVAATSDASGVDAANEALPSEPSLCVDADTARLLGDRFVVRPDQYELVLVRESGSLHARTLLGRETRCVGRDREIGLITSVYEECRDEPDARVVWVTGAPGIGKSRVRDEVLARIDARVWSAQTDPTRSGVALGLLADLVRSAASVTRDDNPAEQLAALEHRACARVPEAQRERVFEFLCELLRLDPKTPSQQLLAARAEASVMGDQLRRAACDLALAELARGPLAIVVEDLHWADAASVRIVSDLVRVARDKPLFLLLFGRPEAKDALRLLAERQPTGVSLGKLGTKAMERLVADALGESPTAPRVAAIAARAAGNPFYAEELVRASRSGGPAATDTLTTNAALAMVESRLTSLEPDARRVMRAASVFGQQFATSDVVSLLGVGATEQFVDAWCTWLGEREILSTNGAGWTFRHALVRDAAYGMLTEADRKAAHALAADVLESSRNTPGPVIAEHWSAAGEPARAARWFASSAGDALEANDLGACIDLGARALDAMAKDERDARGTLHVVLAEACRWRGDYDHAREHAQAALAIVPPGDARFFRALADLVAVTGTAGPPEEFESAVAKLAATEGEGDAVSIAWSRGAMHLLVRGDARGDAMLARASRAASSDLARGRVEQGYALRASLRGELEEIVRRYEASVAALERAGDVRTACVQELNLVAALCDLGQHDGARARLAHGAREAERLGLLSAIALGHHLDGIVLAREDRVADAVAAQRRALDTFAAQGNTRMEGGVRCHLAELGLRRGQLEEALGEATRSEKLLAASPPARARALAVLALVHVARRDTDAALASSAEALAIAETSGVESGESLVYRARADALELAGSGEAGALRERGRQKLEARALAIADHALRDSMLRVPENAL